MSHYEVDLKANWMDRPYFGTDEEAKGNCSALMQCPTLGAFLNGKTGGLFLVSGDRGVGKSTLVRQLVETWKMGRQEVPVVHADAADLGLYEPHEAKELERVLIKGLLRLLAEEMLTSDRPSGEPRCWPGWMIWTWATAWDWAQEQWQCLRRARALDNALLQRRLKKRFGRELGRLLAKATATNYRRTSSAEQGSEQGVQAKTDAKGGFGKLGLGLGWNKKRTLKEQLSWDNATDVLREEMRRLFETYRRLSWPLLVLDEWDRFADKPDAASESGGSSKPGGSPGHSPTFDEVLTALGRIKGLLADYPAPMVVVAGEALYRRVLHTHHDLNLAGGQPLSNIFNQKCFLAPLPAWEEGVVASNPLLPYLRGIAQGGTKEEALQPLADYLLFEVGLNPHAVKVFLGHYVSLRKNDKGVRLRVPRNADTLLKEFLGRTLYLEWMEWEKAMGGVLPAEPFRRWCWFRYLRGRLWTYWRSPTSRKNGNFYFPATNLPEAIDNIPQRLNLVLGLDKNCTKGENDRAETKEPKKTSTRTKKTADVSLTQAQEDTSGAPDPWKEAQATFDLRLWEHFYKTLGLDLATSDASLGEEILSDLKTTLLNDWQREGILECAGTQVRVYRYDPKVGFQRMNN